MQQGLGHEALTGHTKELGLAGKQCKSANVLSCSDTNMLHHRDYCGRILRNCLEENITADKNNKVVSTM